LLDFSDFFQKKKNSSITAREQKPAKVDVNVFQHDRVGTWVELKPLGDIKLPYHLFMGIQKIMLNICSVANSKKGFAINLV